MKKNIAIIIMMVFVLSFVGCNNAATENHSPQTNIEQPHLYWKDIDVVVTDINKKTWFATTRWWIVEIEVYNEEYGLTESFEIKGSGLYGCPNEWEYEVGDIVKAELNSWVMDSTGEVVRREINSLK